jgi:hypothetical protein
LAIAETTSFLANQIKSQIELRLILTPFHLRPLSAGTRRARLMTEAAGRPSSTVLPVTSRAQSQPASPPRRLAAARSAPALRAATERQHRLYRSQNGSWWELEAHSLRGVHRDGIVVVERVDELPVLVGKRRRVHDVGGWRFQMLGTRPSRVPLTRSRDLAKRIELRGGCAFE